MLECVGSLGKQSSTELSEAGAGRRQPAEGERAALLGSTLFIVPGEAKYRQGRLPREDVNPPPRKDANVPYGNCCKRFAMRSAASAHSVPLFPTLPPARWIACSTLSQVNTPKSTGTPLRKPASIMPRLTARLIC